MREFQLNFISNKKTARFFKIINFMEVKRLFTLKEIAEANQLSERTIANDIKYLKDHFKESIQLKSGNSGYFFEEKNVSLYQLKKQQLLKNECLFEIISDILNGKLRRIDELAHHYHYSESSFRRIINNCNPVFESYGLKWRSNPLTLEGNEASIRKFFKDFYYEGIETQYTLSPPKDLTKIVFDKAYDNIGRYDWGSGTTPTSFLYSLYITLKRVENKSFISLPVQLVNIVYQDKDFDLLCSLSKDIEQNVNISIPKTELAWLYLESICKRTYNRKDLETKFYDNFNIWPNVQKLSDRFLNDFEFNIKEKNFLSTYIKSYLVAQKVKDSITPVLNKESKELIDMVLNHSLNRYEKNLKFLKENIHYLQLSNRYINDICASFTLYVDIVIDTHIGKKRIYFLLEGNQLIRQFIEKKAIFLFGQKHDLIFLPMEHLSSELLNGESVDLIVTNYNRYISDYINDKNYIVIEFIPSEKDWNKINKMVNTIDF